MAKKIDSPSKVECVGNKPKIINEYIGLVNSKTTDLSIAQMDSPGGWSEPGQRPEFDEYTLVLNGTLKVETEDVLENKKISKAKNFFRKSIDLKNKNIYHHIGIYCYKVSILEKFVNLKQTRNESINKLEQLRAIDNNIRINVALASSSPIGVDTEEDYLALKKIMEYKS